MLTAFIPQESLKGGTEAEEPNINTTGNVLAVQINYGGFTMAISVEKYEISKHKTKFEEIMTMYRHIHGSAGLIQSVLEIIDTNVQEELETARKNAKLTEFQEQMACWDDYFVNIRQTLRGIQTETDVIHSKFLEILHFVKDNTGINLIY